MKTVYVLMNYGSHHEDLPYPIGVFDSVGEANLGIAKYFGPYYVISVKDVRDSGIEFIKAIDCDGQVFDVHLFRFNINEV